jgi:L-ascorbate metabolism protein UlaG (beta-lactamase superfamily)
MIQTEGAVIYIDPYEGDYVTKANLILITHSHHDHCDVSKINQIRTDDTSIIAPSDCVTKIGGEVQSLQPGETIVIGTVTIKAVPAYNVKRFRSPGVLYHPRSLGVGYVLTVENKTIYHAGDTGLIPEMEELRSMNIDVALLPCGGVYTMDNREALEAARAINPKKLIRMHRRNGMSPTWNLQEFKKVLQTTSQIELIALEPGETHNL